MKAALNGALNLSILDGWWDERYDGENGWAIPSADDGTVDPERRDDFEAEALYDLLEREIVAAVLRRPRPPGCDGAAHDLGARARRCSRRGWCATTSATLYAPAAPSRAGSADDHAGARRLASTATRVRAAWPGVAVVRSEVGDGGAARHAGHRPGARESRRSRPGRRGRRGRRSTPSAPFGVVLEPGAGGGGRPLVRGHVPRRPGRRELRIRVLPRHADLGTRDARTRRARITTDHGSTSRASRSRARAARRRCRAARERAGRQREPRRLASAWKTAAACRRAPRSGRRRVAAERAHLGGLPLVVQRPPSGAEPAHVDGLAVALVADQEPSSGAARDARRGARSGSRPCPPATSRPSAARCAACRGSRRCCCRPGCARLVARQQHGHPLRDQQRREHRALRAARSRRSPGRRSGPRRPSSSDRLSSVPSRFSSPFASLCFAS